jgi:hypothetical protein
MYERSAQGGGKRRAVKKTFIGFILVPVLIDSTESPTAPAQLTQTSGQCPIDQECARQKDGCIGLSMDSTTAYLWFAPGVISS